LPYLEQQSLYQQFFSNSYWDNWGQIGSPMATPLSVLICPSDSGIPSSGLGQLQLPLGTYFFAVTSYRPNGTGVDPYTSEWYHDGVVNFNPVQITAITDGTSNTILFGEFSNFDPNWPQFAEFRNSPNYPLSLISSAWSYEVRFVTMASGYYPLN